MRKFLLAGFSLVGTAILAGPGVAQSVRDLTVIQSQVYETGRPKPGPLSVLTLLDRQDATYGLGETVRLAVKTSADAYVTVLNIGASGRVTQLFPNAAQPDNHVHGGEAIEVPSAQSGAKITVSGPVGAELIKVIATSRPLPIIREDQLQGTGVFRSLNGDVETLKRDLTVVSENPPQGVDVAVANQIIRTVPARAGVTVGQGLVIPAPVAGGQSGVAQALVPGGQGAYLPVIGAAGSASRLPLLLAADRTSYRTGERLLVAVTAMEACFLSVHKTDATGQIRQLFPTRALPAGQIGTLQTLLISGGPAPQSVAAGAPGPETITAVCTRGPRPGLMIRSADELVPPEARGEFETSQSGSQGEAGYAQITVTVTP